MKVITDLKVSFESVTASELIDKLNEEIRGIKSGKQLKSSRIGKRKRN